ncbi:MAG: TonB-dependent receptor [Proteiniphilum sp.]
MWIVSLGMFAQNVTVSGIIIDAESNEVIIGGAVTIKGNALLGAVSGLNGDFTLSNVPRKSILIVSYLGFEKQEIDLNKLKDSELKSMRIVMQENLEELDEVVVTATGVQKKVSVVGAITSIEPTELKAPTRSLSTQLAGRVSGVTFVQSSGQPGKDGASFIIRGINSVSGNTQPLILIDGLKRSIDDVDPNDIESFSVLKDASATAVYGLEGSNGIIVIKTKSGTISSRPSVRVSYSQSVNNASYKPDWVDAVDYAKMKNEAYVVRGKKPYYTEEDIQKFGDNDMDFYPNVDWYKTMVKSNNISSKANFNISGGGSAVSYYMSGGFYREEGMFNSGSNDNNANYNQFNFRSNVKADLSSTTTLALGFDGRYNTTTEPGGGVSGVLNLMNNLNPTLFPPEYSNGTAPEEPIGITNPYSQLTKTGFSKSYENLMSTNLNLTQKLNFITEGLFANFIASFTKNNYNSHVYSKQYQKHAPDFMNSHNGTGRDENGNLVTINKTPDVDDKMSFTSVPATGHRVVEIQGSLNYVRSFFTDLHTTGLVLYKQREYLNDAPQGTGGALLINALPTHEQSIAGRLTFDWKHRYFLDVNFGGSGSQLFTPDKRWSYFPSVGIGWLLSDEPFWENLYDVVDLLKLRATYGQVGAPGSASRFGYLATTGSKPGYTFGFGTAAGSGVSVSGIGETRLEQLGLTWERNEKINLGVELGLFGNFKLIADLYRYDNKNQLINLNRLPSTMGLPAVPMANLGRTVSQGVDFDITYSKAWRNFRINYIKGIISYNKNTIKENGQLDPKVPYQSGIGLDYGRNLTYIALGLFKDQADIDDSPVQVWNDVMPGDIKYKDIDGDGVITPLDRIWLGNIYPKWTYSVALDLNYKNITFATRIIAKSDVFRNITGGRIPFNPLQGNNENGAIYKRAMKNHWTPAFYSGTSETENPNAEYPRLAFGTENLNNSQPSTFWLRESSYVQIADMEIGYNWIPKEKLSSFKNIYVYGRCDNVYTFSKFKDWNPEQTSSYAYPLKRTFTLGFEIGLNL